MLGMQRGVSPLPCRAVIRLRMSDRAWLACRDNVQFIKFRAPLGAGICSKEILACSGPAYRGAGSRAAAHPRPMDVDGFMLWLSQ